MAFSILSDRQVHNPSHDFRREEGDGNPEVVRERFEVLVPVEVMGLLRKECQIPIDDGQLPGLPFIRLKVLPDYEAWSCAESLGTF